ncbi:exosome complex component RRP45A-like isoform X1 [Papaver somniferum]|uniref:exosome complex component RRP45A-like isoform X1 n=1 Tax=Papaver somniferum TaxID=3469 RepID=UPI000E6F710A|nr:exosome complex component RRP45A-like isoform X1 [Papaver somniferum]
MEQRLANTWKMANNEKKFIEISLLSDLRVDGRTCFQYRGLNIKFGREDGSSEVQLGKTLVMGSVTSQLVQPYRDRPNEGTLSIYTEFSPMADPSFEAGRPGEFAVELGRIIDRGLRESRAVDTESLCVLAAKLVWAIRIDLHILDNGGNLVDAANIAALAALMTFRRPECTLGGEDGQELIVHPPEVKEPLPLIIHHLPIAVTFGTFGDGNVMVIDPSHDEEVVMRGRITATLNANGDICSIQKVGEGVMQSSIMQCLRIAKGKADDITTKIRSAVEAHCTERAARKIKRHPSSSVAVGISRPDTVMMDKPTQKGGGFSVYKSEESCSHPSNGIGSETLKRGESAKASVGAPSSWDPYSKGVDANSLKTSLAVSAGRSTPTKEQKESIVDEVMDEEPISNVGNADSKPNEAVQSPQLQQQSSEVKTLKDAVKPKNKRKKKTPS